MKQFKTDIIDAIMNEAQDCKIVSLREVAAGLGYNHINRQDVGDILFAVKKRLPGYRPVWLKNHPHESLFMSLNFVENDVEFDDGSEFEEEAI